MKRLLVLDNAVDHKIYKPVEHWEPYISMEYDSFRSSFGEIPDSLENYSHILITGSEGSVINEIEWQLQEEELIREAVAKDKVILGSCFGHQLIAKALFGEQIIRKRERPEVGWKELRVLEEDQLVGRRGGSIFSFVVHYDEVFDLPEDRVQVLLSTDECQVHGFKLIDKPVYGFQPHPEMTTQMGKTLLEKYSKTDMKNRDYFLNILSKEPKDSGWIVPLMENFQKI